MYNTRVRLNRIAGYITELNNTKNRLNNIKSDVNLKWSADEVRYINNALNKVILEISEVTNLMNTLIKDISRAVEDIKKEDSEEK